MSPPPIRWSTADQITLRQIYGRMPICEVAAILGRTISAIYTFSSRTGVVGKISRSIPPSKYRRMVSEEAAKRDVPIDLILSNRRSRHAAHARQMIWKQLRAEGYSLYAIGYVAGRDHTTILSGLRRAKRNEEKL